MVSIKVCEIIHDREIGIHQFIARFILFETNLL